MTTPDDSDREAVDREAVARAMRNSLWIEHESANDDPAIRGLPAAAGAVIAVLRERGWLDSDEADHLACATAAIASAMPRPHQPQPAVVTVPVESLRRIEWSYDEECTDLWCPGCNAGRERDGRHKPDCWIAAALGVKP